MALKGEEDDVKMLKVVAEPVVVVAQPADTLTQMQIELQPLARKVRTSAAVLLIFSLLRMCSPAGFFGLIAASSVLCCAAPGSLGTAYASRCARVMSIFSAVFSGLALFVIALLAISPAFHGGVRKMIFEHCEGMAMDLPQPIIDFEPSFDADVGSHMADTASSPPRHTIETVLSLDSDAPSRNRIIGAEGYGNGPGQRPHDRNVAPLPKTWADSHPGMPGMSEEALALLNEGAHDERATILGKDGHGLPPAHLGPPAHILGKDGHGQPPAHILGKDGHGRPPVEQHLLGANGHGLPPAYLRDTPSTSSMVGRLATTSITSAVSVKDGVRRLTATIGWSMPMAKDHPMPPPTAKDLMAEPEPMHEQCERVAKWAGMFGPQMLLAWALFELCIFVPAVMLAKRSLRLYKTARRLGASAI